jgi:hypothetical protein
MLTRLLRKSFGKPLTGLAVHGKSVNTLNKEFKNASIFWS